MELAPNGFRGTHRFDCLRLIGHGGMGIVYECFDRVQVRNVALKVLPTVTPDRLLRFKREFRAAAEVQHENLVRLGELIGSDETWYFTMELVTGPDIVGYVRGHGAGQAESDSRRRESTETRGPEQVQFGTAATATPLDAGEEERLRAALPQLAAGLCALHEAGITHRDVKPSNVLVTPQGRVVLLDFGLASLATRDTTLVGAGTPLYMAPEQVSGAVTAAADWYAFGVLMFELLTGSLPFTGAAHLVLLAKQGGTAPPVRAHNPAVPADLAELCDALLASNPEARPSGEQILRVLRAPRSATGTGGPPRPVRRGHVHGREREWQTLEQAFADVRSRERPLVLSVRGESGIGKTTLVRGFVEALEEQGSAIVMSGRCHERELVPYKAIDDIFDALSQWLRHQRSGEVELLLPGRAGVLARVFPVFARVSAIARAEQPGAATDPQELRSLLFAAVRELLVNIARLRPLVLVIDDLHWADGDSLALLSELLRTPTARILLLCTLRAGAGRSSLDRLFGGAIEERCLSLGALTVASTVSLADQLLRAAQVDGVDARQLGSESGGHPFFLRELVRQIATRGGRPELLSLDGMLRARIAEMSSGAIAVLQLLAIAAAPRATAAIREAAALDAEALAEACADLREHGFLHVRSGPDGEWLDVSHDRVRQAAAARLSEEDARLLHGRLAEVLERRDDAAGAAVHFRHAGEPARASRHYLRAAELASSALAFGDAVEHYDAALELGPWSDDERRSARIKQADALSNAGRGRAAAELYRAAAQGAPASTGLELKRRAASELMRSGYLEEGRLVSREVLAEAGMGFARLPLLSLIVSRLRLRLRRVRHRDRGDSLARSRLIERIDVCWSLATALVMTDHVQGAYLLARGLLLALRAGDPARFARAIAAEAALSCGFGARAHARAYRLIETAERMSEQLADARLSGTVALMAGIGAHLGGRFAEAKAHLERAEGVFRSRCTGSAWELDTCKQFWLESSYYLGELDAFADAVARTLKEAEDRGLMYALANLRTGLPNTVWLIADDPARAAAESEAALAEWSGRGFHVQHWYQLMSNTQVELYLGHGGAAHRRIESGWSNLSVAHLQRISHTRIVATHLRGRAALAAATERAPGPTRSKLLKLAREQARRLEREQEPWASALAALVIAGAEKLEGRAPSSTRLSYLRGMLERSDLKLYAFALESVQSESDPSAAALARAGVRNPRSFARMLLPGLS